VVHEVTGLVVAAVVDCLPQSVERQVRSHTTASKALLPATGGRVTAQKTTAQQRRSAGGTAAADEGSSTVVQPHTEEAHNVSGGAGEDQRGTEGTLGETEGWQEVASKFRVLPADESFKARRT